MRMVPPDKQLLVAGSVCTTLRFRCNDKDSGSKSWRWLSGCIGDFEFECFQSANGTHPGRAASFFAEAFSLRGSGVRPEDSAAVEKAPSQLMSNL